MQEDTAELGRRAEGASEQVANLHKDSMCMLATCSDAVITGSSSYQTDLASWHQMHKFCWRNGLQAMVQAGLIRSQSVR